jgi:hypothetical protein
MYYQIIKENLPTTKTWLLDTIYISFNFSTGHNKLKEIDWHELGILRDLGRYWEFGECEYVGAQTFKMCISDFDGSIVGINPESDSIINLYNSNIENYINTYWAISKFTHPNEVNISAALAISAKIDPLAYEQSEWVHLITSCSAQ